MRLLERAVSSYWPGASSKQVLPRFRFAPPRQHDNFYLFALAHNQLLAYQGIS